MVGVRPGMPVRGRFEFWRHGWADKVRPNKGAVVLGINEQTIREHYEIRALLEVRRWLKAAVVPTNISPDSRVHYAAEKRLAENTHGIPSDLNQAFI